MYLKVKETKSAIVFAGVLYKKHVVIFLSWFHSVIHNVTVLRSTRRVKWDVSNATPIQTRLDAQRKRRRDRRSKLCDIHAVDLPGEPEIGLDDVGVEVEEVLRDAAETRVVAVEASDEGRGLAVVVELVVHAAHGEDGALVLGQRVAELHARAILHDEAGLDDAAVGDGCDGKDLRRPWVDMRRVHSTGVHEAHGEGDAQVGEDGKFGAVGEDALAALADEGAAVGRLRVGVRVEVVLVVGGALGLDEREAADRRAGQLEGIYQVFRRGWVEGRGRCVALASYQRDGGDCESSESKEKRLTQHFGWY